MTSGARFHRVNLKGKFEESIITNSSRLASLIEEAKCSSTEDVVREMEREIRGEDWEDKKKGFEQHMLEEDRVREDWRAGVFEEKESCRSCATMRMHGISQVSAARNSVMRN